MLSGAVSITFLLQLNMKIVNIDNSFRDSLVESLDNGDITGKKRPYYLNLVIKGFSILIPLRSHCPESPYKIPIYNRRSRQHGLDCSKMIIVAREDVPTVTSASHVSREVILDILSKRERIRVTVIKTLNDYLSMKRKEKLGLDLNEEETFLKQRTTLINFDEEINTILTK